MTRLRPPVVILAILSLMFSEWLVIAHMASVVDASCHRVSCRRPAEASTAKVGCRCVFHQRKRQCDSPSIPGVKSSGKQTSDSSPSPASPNSEHDSDHCSLCRAFYTSRSIVIEAPPLLIANEDLAVFLSAEYVLPAVSCNFASAQSQRGPPRASRAS